MKRITLFCLALQLFCLSAHSQLHLNTGETWTYQFNSLPHTGFISVFVTNPVGGVSFTIDSSTFQTGDKLRYEMFENNTSEMPICSGLMASAPPFTVSCQAPSSWDDLQGVIRLTMVSGSLTVTGITVEVIRSGPNLSSYDIYSSTFVSVPQPPRVLSAVVRNGKLVVSWPQGSASDLLLQGATNFSPVMMWNDVTNTVYAIGTNYVTTNDIIGAREFFRLRSR